MAFTPREPSLCTTNMLRSAHRAGLTPKVVPTDAGCRDSTENCNPPTTRSPPKDNAHRDGSSSAAIGGVGALKRERHPSSGFSTDSIKSAWASRLSSRATATLEGIPGHAPGGACTKEHAPLRRRTTISTKRPALESCRPVLLSFHLSPEPSDRDVSPSCMDAGGREDSFGSRIFNADSTGLSEWKSMFPHFGNIGASDPGESSPTSPWGPEAESCHTRKAAVFFRDSFGGVGSEEDNSVTAEDLWGPGRLFENTEVGQ